MLLVFTSNNFISPRPSELTPGQLLIDISCPLISPRFSFAHSSCLSYPPFPTPPPQKKKKKKNYKDAQTDSLALGLLFQDAREGTSGDNFQQGQANIFTAIKIQDNWSLNNSQLKGLFFQVLCKS